MSQPSAAATPVNAKRILVAEDNEAFRLYLQLLLAGQGYRVVLVGDGEEAVSQYREQGPFDLAILDVHMPRLGGPGAWQQIRAMHPGARGVVLSGSVVEDEGSAPNWAQGFDASLAKPFETAELLQLVQRLLQSRPSE